MKRIIALIFAFLIFSQCVYAESTVNKPVYDAGTLTVNGVTDTKGLPVRLEVLKKGVEYKDLKNVTSENISTLYLNVSQTISSEDGSFNFEIPVDETIGNYLIRVGFFGGGNIEESYATYTVEDLNTAVDTFLADPAKDVTKLDTLLNDYYGGLGIGYTSLVSLGDKKTLAYQNIISNITVTSTKEELIQEVNKELSFRQLANEPTVALLKSCVVAYSMDNTLWFKEYDKLSLEEKESIVLSCKDKGNMSEIEQVVKNTVIIKELKKSLWNEIYSVLQKYDKNDNYIGVDYLTLNKVPENSEARKNIMSDLKTYITDGTITNILEIPGKISELILKYPYKAPVNEPVGGGGGGGGGHSGIRVPAVSLGTTPNSTIATPETAKKEVFNDISEYSWAEEAIMELYNKGVINGKGNQCFDPSGSVTREEFTTMIVRALGFETNTSNNEFSDVSNDRWSKEYINTAAAYKIISGYENGTFRPEEFISRQDMAVIAQRAISSLGKSLTVTSNLTFDDEEQINEYAVESVKLLARAGIVNGNEGEFMPFGITSRAEAAVVIYRLLQSCGTI